MAVHAPDALKILGQPTYDETRILGAFQYEYRYFLICAHYSVFQYGSTLAYCRVKNFSTNMRRFLSKCKSFLYLSGSDIYLHRDTNLMPKNPAAWSSWNFLGDVNNKVCLTYWLNVLQVSCPCWFTIQMCVFQIKK